MDLVSLLHSIGYLGIWAIIFTETGILFGMLLPGDTLLFAAGVLAGQGHFNIWIMVTGCFAAALTGNLVGYWLGETLGLPFIRKYCKKFITDAHLEKTHDLFDKPTFFENLYQNNVASVLNDVTSTPVFWVKDEFISLKGLLFSLHH